MAHPRADRKAAAAGVAARLAGIIRSDRIMTDALMTYAYSGDASSYRLVPAVVVIINTEDEVRAVIEAARAERLPLTFRAAGTSLSGQAITDGVLAVLGDGWKKLQVDAAGERVTLGPAIIVANANRALKPFNRKLGPDPASQAIVATMAVVNAAELAIAPPARPNDLTKTTESRITPKPVQKLISISTRVFFCRKKM